MLQYRQRWSDRPRSRLWNFNSAQLFWLLLFCTLIFQFQPISVWQEAEIPVFPLIAVEVLCVGYHRCWASHYVCCPVLPYTSRLADLPKPCTNRSGGSSGPSHRAQIAHLWTHDSYKWLQRGTEIFPVMKMLLFYWANLRARAKVVTWISVSSSCLAANQIGGDSVTIHYQQSCD